MKDRTRNKRTAQHRGWVQRNTTTWKLTVTGKTLGEIEIFVPPGKIEIPPFGNRKWRKFLRGRGIDATVWHACVLTNTTGTQAWREKFDQSTPRRHKSQDRNLRLANVRVYTAYQTEMEAQAA
jgi:hypothetical protein